VRDAADGERGAVQGKRVAEVEPEASFHLLSNS
jgi:hypothetical protein